MAQQFQPGMLVQPGVPVVTGVRVVEAAGKTLVHLQVETVHGSAMYLLDADQAAELARHLADAARQAGTGLIVASPALPTNGNGAAN